MAHVLYEIFTTTGVPYILKCNRGKTFACQVEYNLYHLGIHIIVAYESIQINSKKNPTDGITKIISEMIDAWLMINDTNKWIEGTESVFTVNIQAKRKKVFNDKVEIDLPIFSNPVEDNDKYEIIEEILDKLKHQNPIPYLIGIHNDEFLQLHQKPAKGCPNTEVLQKHNACSIISNTTNEEKLPELVQRVAEVCSQLDGLQINKNSSESNATDIDQGSSGYGGLCGPNSKYVMLISNDGHEFIIKQELAMMSGNIRAILNDPVQIAENEINEIRFKEVPSHVLKEYCKYMVKKRSNPNSTLYIPEFPLLLVMAVEILIAANIIN
ncbi:uncharacterized protein LOC132924717 [Rhopalosiphum padi]|uniref:uncharacterized protein LOC132924717 n=1 Tax=Rhopalosiphum padi TaxID=40932 RepID=UPI00298E217A|nr:uncharacterized protein LOC132924717 [Rhopalosiphum padi]